MKLFKLENKIGEIISELKVNKFETVKSLEPGILEVYNNGIATKQLCAKIILTSNGINTSIEVNEDSAYSEKLYSIVRHYTKLK